jgi:recombination protein RecA
VPPKAKKTFSTDWRSHNATDAAVAKFEAEFAKTTGVELTSGEETTYEVIPTGILSLDLELTVGGWPVGRIVEVWGPEHAGKTTLAILACVQAQKQYPNKRIAWVDMEQTFDSRWAELLGLDLTRVWRPPVKTAEETATYTRRFTQSGLCSVVVLDSVGGMIAKMEFEKEADEATVGLVAKIVTRCVNQCSPIAKSNGTLVFVINQVRSVIGGYGADTSTAGGWALKHATTVKVQVKRGERRTVTINGQPIQVGYEMKIKVEKNKMGPYGGLAEIWFHNRVSPKYGPIGVEPVSEAAALAARYAVFPTRPGGYYTMVDGSEIRGKDKIPAYLAKHPEQVSELRKLLLAKVAEDITEEDSDDPTGLAEMVDA